jgi:hypothetical protein
MRLAIAVLWLFANIAGPAFGPGGRFHLEQSQGSFGAQSNGVVETLGGGRTKFHPLPQSTCAEYVRLRPQDLQINPFPCSRYERDEFIGPHQIEGNQLWFGKHYYDGEGMRGVGAFGYFDTAARRYTLFSPPEIARYEISAILVEKDVVWLGLDRFGEDISTSPGGLVRWDRTTHEARHYPLEFVIDQMRPEGDSLRLSTHDGYALFRDGDVHRYSTSGKPMRKFPPPPTHY